MSDKYITVASYATTSEANIVKEKLTKAGIEAFISHDNPLLEPIDQNENKNVNLNILQKDLAIASKLIGPKS